jgi:uncharacterized protein (DUF697 family)
MRISYSNFVHFRANEQAAGAKDEPPSGTEEERVLDAEAETLHSEAENVIKNHVMVALPLGLVPVPVFDLVFLTGNQLKMVHALSKLYDRPFARERAKAVVLSLVSGSAPVLGILGLSTGARLVPGIGTLMGSGGVALFGGALTYAVGRVFVEHFESGGTVLDIDLKKAREVMRKELRKGREVVARMRERAKASAGSTAGLD